MDAFTVRTRWAQSAVLGALVALALVLAACSEPAASPTKPGGPTPVTADDGTTDARGALPNQAPDDIPDDLVSSPAPSGAPGVTPSVAASAPDATNATWEVVAAGFDGPVATVVDPRSDDLLVVELPGRISRLDGTSVLDLTDRVTTGGERGLLDATVTPDGSHLVVHYSGDDGATTLSTFPVLGNDETAIADPDDEQVLLELDQPASNHNGGSIVFGPDGMLYLALGDGGQGNDAFGNGADPTTPLGAILRLDVTSRPGTLQVPEDNPFVGTDAGDDRVWAHGLRNPWRIATDGQRWYVADVGQDAVEEVSIVPATMGPDGVGWDFGWPDWEGEVCRADDCETASIQPVATLTHDAGACSIIGGAIVTAAGPDRGRFFFTDLCDPRVWSVGPDGEVTSDVPLEEPALALDTDAGGLVVALTRSGRLLRRVGG